MKKNNKIALTLLSICAVTSFFLINPNEEITKNIVESKKAKQGTPKLEEKKISRAIASIPKAVSTPSTPKEIQREYRGNFSNLNDITLVNKVDKNWKEKYQKNFLRMTSKEKVKGFKIELKKSMVQVKNNIGRNLEHVVVSYIKPNGQPFSFEALIDSETGRIVQTWNKTRYEFKKPFKIQGDKYLYKKEV